MGYLTGWMVFPDDKDGISYKVLENAGFGYELSES